MLTFTRKMSTIAPAKIVSQKTYQVAGKLKITEHFFDVPKDYSKPQGGTIRVFARSVKKHDTSVVPETSKDKEQLPWMCYLQGGPGMECRSPQSYPWTQTVLDRGYQLLYLDQRGTGLSTPVTASTLQMRGYNDVQAKYLKLYRADSIVKDCEAIRQALTADYPDEKKKWSIMGQSFGGFCSITYLSFHPEGLREAFLFGGLQPLVKSPDEVYRRLYKRVSRRNEAYYAKCPDDIDRVKAIMNFLKRFGDGKIKLPSEGTLTRRRFRQLGIMFGFHGGLDAVHDIILKASSDIEAFGHLTRGSLAAIDNATGFDDHLIYAILHEPIYCEGNAPAWSAHRLMEEYPAFDLDKTEGPIYFTGEMIYPSMFEDYTELRKVQDVAEMVASDADWGPLFDEVQLAKNEVPVYAASYFEDMYVDFDLSMETAAKIKGCKVFTTNVMFHDAIRSKMEEVVKQAFALRDDVID
ncbi:hypothetical protein LTR85_010612 [Meristemomyces frigidus]|nr:hypothetical protein LTR85_010612 [Meristemomyces frigidus]